MILYRKAEIKDKSSLFEFYRKAYPKNYKFRIDPYWTWQNISNPLISGDNESHIYIAIDDEKDIIVGQYVLVPQEFIAGDEKLVFYWGMYFFVLEEYRGEGIGKKLQQLTIEDSQLYMAVSVASSTRRLILRLGGVELPDVYTMSCLLRYDNKVAKSHLISYFRIEKWSKPLSKLMSRNDAIASIIGNITQGYFKRRIAKINSKFNEKDSSIDIYESSIDDPGFLNIRSSIKNDFDVYPIDDIKSLKWRFKDHPNKKYNFFISENDDWSGYLILRSGQSPESNMGIISEIYATSNKGYEELIKFSINHFGGLNCESINVLLPASNDLKLFESMGFMKINMRTPVALAQSTSNLNKYKGFKKWFLSFESQDMDFFPNLRL